MHGRKPSQMTKIAAYEIQADEAANGIESWYKRVSSWGYGAK
jgi:hypothetical protein